MNSSSSGSFASPNNSPRSAVQSDEQSEAVLDQLVSVRHHLNALARELNTNSEVNEYQNPDFYGFESVSQPVSPTQLSSRTSNPSGLSRSLENLVATNDREPLSGLAATSRDSFTGDLPLFSRDPSPELLTNFNVRKTRQSVQRGFRSPLRELPYNRPRKVRSKASVKEPPATMSRHSSTEDLRGDEGGLISLTPRWDLFIIKNTSFKRNLATDLTTMLSELANEEATVEDFEDMLVDVDSLETELQNLEISWNKIVDIENIEVETWTKVGDELRTSRKEINKVKRKAQKAAGTGIGQPGKGKCSTITDDTLAAIRNSAQAPKVNLPTFSGEITEYSAFKKNFQYVITLLNCNKKLWGTHLYNSLKGEALKYVGSQRDWIDKYQELWENLDDRYANRWVLANDTIKAFIGKPIPDDSPDEIDKFFYSQVDALKSVIDLKMTVEQLGVSIICQTLPDEIGKDVKQGLKALYPNKRQYAFTIKDIMGVYNDLIAIKGAAKVPEPLHSTLSLKAAVQRSVPNNHASVTSQQNNHQQQDPHFNNRGRGWSRGYNRGRGDHRGRGDYRGRGGQQPPGRRRHCMLCATDGHGPGYCSTYNDASKRRERLKELNLCTACTGRVHHGECPDHLECFRHPGYKHLSWTCGNGVHPGKQEPSD